MLFFGKVPLVKKLLDKRGGVGGSIKTFHWKFSVSQSRKTLYKKPSLFH